LRVAAAAIALAFLVAGAGEAHADKIQELSRRLSKAHSEKARIAAAVSLGHLKNDRTLKPLVLALKDSSRVVRAVAASALGELADSRALPALRRATRDADSTVRKKAVQSIALIRSRASQRNKLADKRFVPKSRQVRSAHYQIRGREAPLLSPRKPELLVAVRTASDDTPGKLRKAVRRKRASMMRSFMVRELSDNRHVTINEAVAAEFSLDHYSIDLSIVRLNRQARGPYVELECEIRIAISNERGKMISFLTGGAKVQVPKRTFRRQYENQMRREALENAVKSVHQDLVRFLRSQPS
jgi:hypothetical protein